MMDDKVYEIIGIRNYSDVTVIIKKELDLTGTLTTMFLGKKEITEKRKVFVVGEKLLAGLEGYDVETGSVKINFQCNRFSIPVDAAEFKELHYEQYK